jgi:hypothetical protein
MTAHADGMDIEDLSGVADDDPPSRLQRHLPSQVREHAPAASTAARSAAVQRRCTLRVLGACMQPPAPCSC